MTAKELFEAGDVRDAIAALGATLRSNPTDARSRTFLFELLCFSGEYDRAEKQLGVLAQGTKESEMGAILYYSALHAERSRHELFRKQEFPTAEAAPSPKGTLNGKPFDSIRDADPQIGSRLEVYAAGAYLWIPFQHIASIQVQRPAKLRDTLWTQAFVVTAASFQGTDIGEVIIPAVYPFSWKGEDQEVWLGRATQWAADDEGHEFPVGHKTFLVDGEEIPLVDIESIEFSLPEGATVDNATS
jgi:type VI secretion system protein ImpE